LFLVLLLLCDPCLSGVVASGAAPPVYSLLRVAASDVAPDFSRTRNGTILTVLGMASSVCLPQNFIKGLGKSGQLSMRTLQEGSLYVAFTLCSPQIHISHLLLQLGESVQRFLQGMVPARKKSKRKEKKKRKEKENDWGWHRQGSVLALWGGAECLRPWAYPLLLLSLCPKFSLLVWATVLMLPLFVVWLLLMWPLFMLWLLLMFLVSGMAPVYGDAVSEAGIAKY